MLRTLSPSDMDLQVHVQLCCKSSHPAAHPTPSNVSVLHTPSPRAWESNWAHSSSLAPVQVAPGHSCGMWPQLRDVATAAACAHPI